MALLGETKANKGRPNINLINPLYILWCLF